jgi:hypothetical protein
MKQQVCKTSTFVVDLDKSTFAGLESDHKIIQYSVPTLFKDKPNEYGVLHNWAKDNIDHPYYLNLPAKKLFVLLPKQEDVPPLSFENNVLNKSEFTEFKSRDKFHFIVKLLLAKYFEINENFVTNDKFFLHVTVNRSNTWATVLRADISHNYKKKDALEFFIKDEATRLRKINHEEFSKFHFKDIIYGQSIKGGQLFFKQLKRSEIKDFKERLFVKPKTGFVKNTKTKIKYHSILDSAAHESSKAFLLERFSAKFISFLNQQGIAAELKELQLAKVDIGKRPDGLSIGKFNVTLIDGRKSKKQKLSEVFKGNESITFVEGEISKISQDDNCLFVMDYNKDDFDERFKSEIDPYKAFKNDTERFNVPKQGICLNENYFNDDAEDLTPDEYLNYEGLNESDLERNLGICVNQLFLKNLLLRQSYNSLPSLPVLKNYTFCFRNYLLFISDGKLVVQKFDTAGELMEAVVQRHPKLNKEEVFDSIYKYHNPFPTAKEFDFLTHKIMFSNENVIEIVDIPERAFYDEDEIKSRIAQRNKKRPKSEFKSKGSDETSRSFNDLIDFDVEDVELSYEELKAKYGKGDEGFLKTIFGSKDERALVRFLNENTDITIKGLKQDNIFSTYTGVWFDESNKQYFVGRTHGYQSKQDKGSQMKQLVIHKGTLNQSDFFELLDVSFIRYKEITVNPYPFKLIEMYETITTPSVELQVSN